jgi:hypothetical protein
MTINNASPSRPIKSFIDCIVVVHKVASRNGRWTEGLLIGAERTQSGQHVRRRFCGCVNVSAGESERRKRHPFE